MRYTIVRQKRKTATIVINDQLEILVKVPKHVTKKQVESLVEKHTDWINETLLKKQTIKEKGDWYYTKRLLYLGKYWPVIMVEDGTIKPEVKFKGDYFKVVYDGDEVNARKVMEVFFREEAKKRLEEFADEYARCLGVTYHKITIRKQATRWGSCSSKGNLSFNMKILCAPIEMVRYVVLHEVAHLKHFNHSEVFWQEVERWMPDYKVRMNYFKQFGHNFII